ncbi:type VI secretion system baseplate subunit TssE [Hyalangium rubrum]|uniref:Type VI secretion system baseplate subunit TssE n=1 Tax=Hyalangium rubrum TaxID=3103134 RepID=A0ABU5HIK1_9BACT|nr:type VI secretion system baseplate subunit TssE [Hyalangium sp. s54d21]MDY7233071.1 type VI secretion system baseplate subunit TssE [Hyalangium sp. s54d21]
MARKSFLDKFKGDKSGHSVRDSLTHVIRNIEAVLNTKSGYGYFVRDFGLGAYTEKYGSRDLLKTLVEEIQSEIEQHEPRMSEVSVELKGRDSGLWLHFELKGVVNDQPCKLRLSFHTVSGLVRVEESA